MPVTIPANIGTVILIQVRMIAAIARMGGHDIREDQVKTLVYTCLAGNAAVEILKDVGVAVGQKQTARLIAQISGETLKRINQAVGLKLLTKAGATGAINLSKAIPLIGGVIGGGIDLAYTNAIGDYAASVFIPQAEEPTTVSAGTA